MWRYGRTVLRCGLKGFIVTDTSWLMRRKWWESVCVCALFFMRVCFVCVSVYVCVHVCVCFFFLISHPSEYSPAFSSPPFPALTDLHLHLLLTKIFILTFILIFIFIFNFLKAKSKGNFLMLLESVEEYSADATRFALADAGDRYVRTCVYHLRSTYC